MITKAAQDDKAFTKDLIFTKSARDAWRLIINSVKSHQGQASILLPSYIGFTEREGSGIFDPVENTDATFDFYGLGNDLSVDIDSFGKLISTKRFNIALVVHYFGFCRSDLIRIRELCDANSVVLVEDCAHAFQLGLQAEGLGVLGDFSIYSVHKWLPVSSGGILKKRSHAIDLLGLPDEDKISLEPAIQLLKSDLEGIAKKRKDNFRCYQERLAGIKGIEIMYQEMHANEIPQTFPIRVRDGLRESLYFHLMDKGMPTIALYYRLIDELDSVNYKFAHDTSDEILNLPVHQDVTEHDIELMTGEIKTFLGV